MFGKFVPVIYILLSRSTHLPVHLTAPCATLRSKQRVWSLFWKECHGPWLMGFPLVWADTVSVLRGGEHWCGVVSVRSKMLYQCRKYQVSSSSNRLMTVIGLPHRFGQYAGQDTLLNKLKFVVSLYAPHRYSSVCGIPMSFPLFHFVNKVLTILTSSHSVLNRWRCQSVHPLRGPFFGIWLVEHPTSLSTKYHTQLSCLLAAPHANILALQTRMWGSKDVLHHDASKSLIHLPFGCAYRLLYGKGYKGGYVWLRLMEPRA